MEEAIVKSFFREAREKAFGGTRRPVRTPEDLFREFEEETYRPMREAFRERTFSSFSEAYLFLCRFGWKRDRVVYWDGKGLRESDLEEHYRREGEMLRMFFRDLPHHPPCAVEFGCGWGRILLSLIDGGRFLRGFGYDLSPSGVDLGNILARKFGLPAFFSRGFSNRTPLPREPYFFLTFFAFSLLIEVDSIIERLLEDTNCVGVVHFEPLAEDHYADGRLDALKQAYITRHRYTDNRLWEVLHRLQEEGRLRLEEHRPNIWGTNPLAPLSAVYWRPCR